MMMDMDDPRVGELARKLAANGTSYLPLHQAALERAWEILASSELDGIELPGAPLYPWEHGEAGHPPDAARRIFTASVESGATGEGVRLHFAAGLACSEVEFRRNVALQVGPHRANGAVIRAGSVELAPFSAAFVSPKLKAILEEAGGGGMPAFSYSAQLAAHYA